MRFSLVVLSHKPTETSAAGLTGVALKRIV